MVAIAGAALAGCAAQRTTVILLPDEDGHVGAVVVSAGGASQRVDHAYDQVVVDGWHAAAKPAARGQPSVDASYADLLKAQPSKPRTFIVNFLLDSTTMTDASRVRIPEILEAVRSRQPTEVTIYGHADATGTEAHNERLSADRARVVAELLHRSDPSLERIEIHACGDRVPLVPAGAHAPEPRNRRAEVVVL
jgi:outer membrane protein OmpA-like peptidoglycan-associated protein